MTRLTDADLAGRFSTRAIHAGQSPDPLSGAIMPPIYQTSTYVHDAFGKHKGYEYARGRNPTREALERNVAALEGGRHGFAFSSGMGCVDSLIKLFKGGDHIVCGEDAYGGIFRLFDRIISNFGVSFTFVDTRDPNRVADAMTPKTVAVFAETPTNPLLRLTDLRATAEIAHKGKALLIVDNTFASPFFQRPLELGADIVFHSTTKYLNGHSDIIGGICVCLDDGLAERIWYIANAAGAVPGPMDCWLALRGTKTLALRMRAHDANGRKLAGWLADRLGAELVHYPGLPTHPQHKLADRQMSGYGGMLSFDLGSQTVAAKFFDALKVFSLAESLGGVESLANHPATMTHASVPAERRKHLGITDGLVRLSVGVEDGEDLLEDVEGALKAAGR
jgi:cystathionine beta-lyase/cystathionine gamma-synthase